MSPSDHIRRDRVLAGPDATWQTSGADVGEQPDQAFGIDIGGSGIKGAVVNTATGELATSRVRITTPQPSTPDAVADVVAQMIKESDWHGGVGATFPAIIKH